MANMTMRGVFMLLWVVLSAMSLCGLSLPAAAQTLRRGNLEPHSLDPQLSSYLFEQVIEHDLYEGLVLFGPGGSVTGGAARDWAISADGTVYTFHLQRGLRWSDGEPLTADDFVYSFRRLVDPATKSPYAFLAAPIRNATEISSGKEARIDQLGIEAVDATIVRITLRAPTPYFLSALTNACFSPVNRRAVERSGGHLGDPRTLIGSGAYVLREWTPNSRIVLKRNVRYRDAAHVRISEVRYLPMPNVSEEYRLYRAGALDITWDVPADQITALLAQHAADFRTFPFFGNYHLAFDLTRPPFRDNAKLRQALAMSVDREALTHDITRGGEQPAYSWVPPGLPGYTPPTFDWTNAARDARQAQARKLYAEAGYGEAKPLSVRIYGIRT
ncbi:MAG: peptide ABC transporter substrate-binding protein, partial [Nevskia sp.]|nr:peptide ABC transporter substrate-binding protein [Nevskia sp.]